MNTYITNQAIDAKEIKRIRSILHLTQKELADFLNVSVKSVERWEISKKTITGTPAALIRLAAMKPEIIEDSRIPEQQYPVRIYYRFHNQLCTVIDVNELNRQVKIKNYTSKILERAFGKNETPSFEEYEEFLESRCFPRERDKMKIMLKELDIPFYDPMLIIGKTNGRMAEDDFSLEIVRQKS